MSDTSTLMWSNENANEHVYRQPVVIAGNSVDLPNWVILSMIPEIYLPKYFFFVFLLPFILLLFTSFFSILYLE